MVMSQEMPKVSDEAKKGHKLHDSRNRRYIQESEGIDGNDLGAISRGGALVTTGMSRYAWATAVISL